MSAYPTYRLSRSYVNATEKLIRVYKENGLYLNENIPKQHDPNEPFYNPNAIYSYTQSEFTKTAWQSAYNSKNRELIIKHQMIQYTEARKELRRLDSIFNKLVVEKYPSCEFIKGASWQRCDPEVREELLRWAENWFAERGVAVAGVSKEECYKDTTSRDEFQLVGLPSTHRKFKEIGFN